MGGWKENCRPQLVTLTIAAGQVYRLSLSLFLSCEVKHYSTACTRRHDSSALNLLARLYLPTERVGTLSYGEMVAGWSSVAAAEPGDLGDPGVGCGCWLSATRAAASGVGGFELGASEDAAAVADGGDAVVAGEASAGDDDDAVRAEEGAESLLADALSDFDLAEEEGLFPEDKAEDAEDDACCWQWHRENPLKKQTEHWMSTSPSRLRSNVGLCCRIISPTPRCQLGGGGGGRGCRAGVG